MKTFVIITVIMAFSLMYRHGVAQEKLHPNFTFSENPLTHNMHIVYDGKFYYTCNGGKPEEGQINKFDADGNLINSYHIELDMRSIMYNAKKKKFYVNCFDRNIYEITDIENGRYKKVLSELYDNEQATLAMSNDGKKIFCMNGGVLKIYSFPKGKLIKTITGLTCGYEAHTGSSAVAVDDKYIYTWDAESMIVYVYNMKGEKLKEVELTDGSFGFSLSYANGMIFISKDGNYEIGNWYGYDLSMK